MQLIVSLVRPSAANGEPPTFDLYRNPSALIWVLSSLDMVCILHPCPWDFLDSSQFKI